MNVLAPVLAAVVVSTGALLGSGVILLFRAKAEAAAGWLLSFAIGTLLAAATVGLLPEALEHAPADRVLPYFLGGILLFIVFERLLRWRHPHAPGHHRADAHHALDRSTALVLLWGDALHNLIDGLVLGITWQVSPELGLVTTLAVVAHEVPQEIGDFAVLLDTGMSRGRALALNYLSALPVIPAALAGALWASESHEAIDVLLPLAAGGFVYIALADLVPALHHARGPFRAVGQLVLLGLGVLTLVLLGRVA